MANPIRKPSQERLLQLSHDLCKSVELEPFLESIVDSIRELTHSEVGSVFVYERETETLRFIAGFWPKPEALNRVRIPLENSIAGLCYKQSKPIIIQNAADDQRVFRDVDQFLGYETSSVLAVPLLYQGETIGVMEAVNKRRKQTYNKDDILTLETLASLAAVVIQNHSLMEKLQKAYSDIEDLDRRKSDFVAIASHELRTPLGVIMGHASFISETATDAEEHGHIQVIKDNARRLEKIIEDLESADNLQAQETSISYKSINLGQLIEEVAVSFITPAQKKHITLITDLAGSTLTAECDPDKIAIALSNLIQNSINFTDTGGHILISAEDLPGFVKVSVVDDGIGIPARDLQRVFERFFQVQEHMTRRHGGMGLGLSIAKAMIEMHNGQIWVESIEKRGSNFSFLLPTKFTQPASHHNAFDFKS